MNALTARLLEKSRQYLETELQKGKPVSYPPQPQYLPPPYVYSPPPGIQQYPQYNTPPPFPTYEVGPTLEDGSDQAYIERMLRKYNQDIQKARTKAECDFACGCRVAYWDMLQRMIGNRNQQMFTPHRE